MASSESFIPLADVVVSDGLAAAAPAPTLHIAFRNPNVLNPAYSGKVIQAGYYDHCVVHGWDVFFTVLVLKSPPGTVVTFYPLDVHETSISGYGASRRCAWPG